MTIYQYLTLGANILIWGIAIGMFKARVSTLEDKVNDIKRQYVSDIESIKKMQNSTDKILMSINDQIVSLNVKMGLLMEFAILIWVVVAARISPLIIKRNV